jgi:histidinol-phosphate aminotransferase
MPTIVPPEHIARLRAYVPGKPIEEVQRELGLTDVIKLASNENPLGPSPRAVAAMTALAAHVEMYPDGGAPLLRAAVARHEEMPPECLIFGNGSDEILHLLAMTFLQPGDETVQGDPSFAMYEIYATQANAQVIKVPLVNYTHDLEAMADAITPRTRLVFIANPNNPTGTLVTAGQVEKFLTRVPDDVLVVMDQAYDEYVRHADKPDLRPLIREGRNIVILHTFSKAYGLAGLRVGYGIARPEIAEVVNRVRSPFNVNLLAQAAAAAALGDQEHIRQSVTLNSEGRVYFYAAFQHMGLDFVPSHGNFVLVDTARDSRAVFDALQRRGVIVRAGAGLGLPHHIRVTVGTMTQNQRFLTALGEALKEVPV